MKKALFRIFLLLLASVSLGACAADDETAGDEVAGAARAGGDIARQIVEKMAAGPQPLTVTDVEPSPVPGLYQGLLAGQKRVYFSEDGSFIIDGTIFEKTADGFVNITEKEQEGIRAEALAAMAEEDMVIFRPETPKATIYVFTDIDCGYCRKLHSHINEMLAKGIQVNYLAYPRAGVDSPSGKKIASVWCADEPQAAMTRAKQGLAVNTPDWQQCREVIAREHALGGRLGVSGTPAIFTARGEHIGGYIPMEHLVEVLSLEP